MTDGAGRRMHPMTAGPLDELPYGAWEATKTTLQLYLQIVGKVQLAYTQRRNHWWNVTFRPTARGLATHVMHDGDTTFDVAFDFIDHRVVVQSNRAHAPASIALVDGLRVRDFHARFAAVLADLGLSVASSPAPYGMAVTVPFADDDAHHRYDAVLVRRWWNAVLWTADVLDEFGFSYLGKQSEPQVFWHSFDLAVGRFSGRPSTAPASPNPVMREAYSREVIAFGFWSGDPNVREPAYYSYTAPEPPTLTAATLRPDGAVWTPSGAGHLALLPYERVRAASDPRAALLAFFESAYAAGSSAAGWDSATVLRPPHDAHA